MKPRTWQLCGAAYLTVLTLATLLWWLLLMLVPASRAHFKLPGPDAVLLAFGPGDLVLFAGAGLLAAHALWRKPERALLPLALHTGAAAYAALYCLTAWLLAGAAPLAALMMSPCLVVQPALLFLCCRRPPQPA